MSYSGRTSSNIHLSLQIAKRKKLDVAEGRALLLDETPNGIVLRAMTQIILPDLFCGQRQLEPPFVIA